MKTAIRLDKNLDCNYLCHVVFNALNKYQSENAINENTILVIDIQNIAREIDLTPLLEYKNIE